MTFEQACEYANELFKENDRIGIELIEEHEEAYIFFDLGYGIGFSAYPLFISKDDSFEPFLETENREYEYFRKGVKEIEIPEKYKIEEP